MFARLKSLFLTKRSRPADESSAFKRQGDEHLKLERLDAAAGCYRHALSISPDDVDACIDLGFVLSQQKQYGEAGRYLQHALSIDPANADAHYLLGTIANNENDLAGSIDHFTRTLESKPDFDLAYRDLYGALFRSGQREEAKELLRKAISVYPASAEFQFYLGNELSREGDYDNAVACYEKALSLQPGLAESHKNLADVLSKRGQFDQAVACYERAVALKPEHTAARIGLGTALESLGRIDEAVACFRRLVALEPESAAAHHYLGNALLAGGATGEAVACYEQVVKLDPANPVQHLLASLSGGDTERAPSEYIEKLFDEYAHKFDSHLVEVLSYSVPEKLAALLRPHADSGGEKWNILDLGCGTGLSGAAVAAYARQLVGVDLSAKMLEKARERNLYHRLEHRDLLTAMQHEADSTYDLVFAADVLVYLGKLDELVDAARRLLRPGGLFAFSVESLEALTGDAGAPLDGRRDYRLNITGRYAHSIAYLERMAMHNGFDALSATGTQSRLDKGQPVQGYLALWRRSAV